MIRFVKFVRAKMSVQQDMPPLIGALITLYSSTAIVYAPLTFVGVATTVYGLWAGNIIQAWLPWFTFGHLLVAMVLFVLVMMVVFYKVVIPSSYAFQVQQQYKHRNPMVDDLRAIKDKQEEMGKKLSEMEGVLSELKGMVGGKS